MSPCCCIDEAFSERGLAFDVVLSAIDADVIKPYVEKMSNPPPLEHLMIGSLYMCMQNQFSNYFQFNDWVTYDVLPQLRTALSDVYTAAGRTQPSYGTSPVVGITIVVADIADLRAAVSAIE